MSISTASKAEVAFSQRNVAVDCGWGRLLIGETFADPQSLADALAQERKGQRDVALYVNDPHVVLSLAPQELFLDPSHTYRLDLTAENLTGRETPGIEVRAPKDRNEYARFREVMQRAQLVPPREGFLEADYDHDIIIPLAAVDQISGQIVGCVTGVDHVAAFDDPENGCSLWGLATNPQARQPGIGEALVTGLAQLFQARGRDFLDLSVLHDNDSAIALYEKLGFERVPIFCIKKKNPINEPLFVGKAIETDLNIYGRIIVDEARRRGINVEIIDAHDGFFRLTYGGRSVVCRESLSEMTSAVAMSRCDNKAVTRRILDRNDVRVPAQQEATGDNEDLEFLRRHKRIVVKQARGEQGIGVYIDIRGEDEMRRAIAAARSMCPEVILEEYVEGEDLRVIVIDDKIVAGAIRRPAMIIGDGQRTAAELIKKQSRRREAATDGESRIPMDQETERCVREAGFGMEDIVPQGQEVFVRKTANLHTGGTIHDVTDILSQTICNAARDAAKALDIPVVGIDFIVPAPDAEDYVVIEANERPGLANHEPQPTAERFIDFLFPQSARERR